MATHTPSPLHAHSSCHELTSARIHGLRSVPRFVFSEPATVPTTVAPAPSRAPKTDFKMAPIESQPSLRGLRAGGGGPLVTAPLQEQDIVTQVWIDLCWLGLRAFFFFGLRQQH